MIGNVGDDTPRLLSIQACSTSPLRLDMVPRIFTS